MEQPKRKFNPRERVLLQMLSLHVSVLHLERQLEVQKGVLANLREILDETRPGRHR